jgi:CubicO group peptidase (beta-lactamase class C family)
MNDGARTEPALPRRYRCRAGTCLALAVLWHDSGFAAPEMIGTVTQVYDGTLTSESRGGLEIGGSGLSATLRDYGRFGLFLMNGGVAGGERILPDDWVREAGSSKTIGGRRVDYGYMIWPFAAPQGSANEGAFQCLGIYGQHIYVNPRERVVIVVWSALPKPTGMEVIADADFFAAAATALR